MASSTGWKLLVAIGALMLATNACGDDGDKGNAGDGDSGDGDKGDGDGDSPKPPAPLLPANTAGNACTNDNECGPTGKCAKELTGGMLISLAGPILGGLDLSMATPGNYCSATCKSDADCNAGGVCFGILPSGLTALIGGGGGGGAISGECRKACNANEDCREGYECAEFNSAALQGIEGLGALSGLLTIPKSCQPAPTVQQIDDSIVGKPCSENADCGAGTCLGYAAATDGGAPTLGSCTATCTADEHCGATEGLCTGVIYGSAGTCIETCSKDADCKRAGEGFTCETTLGVKACTPGDAPEEDEGDAGSKTDPDASTDADPDAGTDAG